MALGLPVRTYPYNLPPNEQVNRPNGLFNQYNLYGKAVHGAEGDYNSIMDQYRRLLAQRNNGGNTQVDDYSPESFKPKQYSAPESFSPTLYKPPTAVTPLAAPEKFNPSIIKSAGEFRPSTYGRPEDYSPITNQYKQSSDLTDAISKLKNLSETGGYSEQGIADLRERGISPLRAVYAGAQRDIERNRAIQGSSASYSALKSKMARELSDKIAGATQNVNAGIAQNVASNKLQASPIYAGVTGQQSDLQNRMGSENAGIISEANRYNSSNRNRVNEANVDLANQGNLYNLGRVDDLNRLNADKIDRGNLFNIGRTDDYNRTMFDEGRRFASVNDEVSRANTDLRNNSALANITRGDEVSRANVDLFNTFGKNNTDERNRARQFNIELPFKRSALNDSNTNQIQQILEGMKGLYGTTPAMANLFGSQAHNAASLQNSINQGNNQNSLELIMNLIRQLSGRS